MIEAVLFDGDQTLWDFERVMRDALVAVADELRAARPGPFADGLSWQDLQDDRTFVAEAMPDVWSLAELRVHGFARTLARRRALEGGDEISRNTLRHSRVPQAEGGVAAVDGSRADGGAPPRH